jgi:nitrogen fixation protein NifU and related proteins
MSDLRQLYQEVILDHSKSPRNFRLPAGASHSAEGHNPLCGDRQTVALELDDQIIRDIGFQGSGCAISVASASMMTEAVKGRSREEAEKLFATFHAVVTGKEPADIDALDKLAVFAGVAGFPMRVKCATLCWHTLSAALSGTASKVTTE